MDYHAIILSAGSGKRMGIKEKKQFLMVGNKCLFIHSLLTFARIREIKKIVLIYNEDDYQRYKIIIDKNGLSDRIDLVPGGDERKHSVMSGLEFLMKSCDAKDKVLIHDGARPRVDANNIKSLMEALDEYKGATLAYKIVDTIKKVSSDGIIKKNVPRDDLWGIMTPQGFELGTIYEAHKQFEDQAKVTDDTELLIKLGEQVKVIEGLKTNIKLTTQEDLKTLDVFFSSNALKIESPKYN